ncbi:RAQPRD family integrative conjugative element protein [Enterobacter hormaechei]|uniref:RAQPRD family integrative conjugative element protein n=1 Tax=Enterobacter hormaechei TaxID=158836 RepID=UPI001CBE7DBE|nr:RAQPRD family integrative conjugative element protein [Enterobacter hormaechei]
MRHSSIFMLLILTVVPQAYTFPESTQLALVLKQLDGVKTSLERSQTSSSTDPQSRYFFDYLQLQQNITIVEQGSRPPFSRSAPATSGRTPITDSQIAVFPAASRSKPETVSLLVLGLFTSVLLLWCAWTLLVSAASA